MNRFNGNPTNFQGLAITVQVGCGGVNFIQDTAVELCEINDAMIEALRARDDWKFAGILPLADRSLASAWWAVLLLRGVLPALFAVVMGMLVGAVQRGESLTLPLALVT